MKFPVNTRKVLLVAAVSLPIAFQLHAQQISPLVGPRPPTAGDERIVRSNVKGYLQVYTPEIPVYDDEGPIGWDRRHFTRLRPLFSARTVIVGESVGKRMAGQRDGGFAS
jgi:hypothetical protein